VTNVICSPTVGYLVCVLWGADEPEPSAGQRGTGLKNHDPAQELVHLDLKSFFSVEHVNP